MPRNSLYYLMLTMLVGNINLFSEVFHFFRNDDDDVITLDRCLKTIRPIYNNKVNSIIA